jgi:tetratricopeptide (TPR) repeat protein
MNRVSPIVFTAILLLYAFSLFAQEPQPQAQPLSEDILVQQLHVPPPSASSSIQELEQEGDSLRAQKDYLDAIDYYRAALQKNDTAVLHNKVGVALIQLSKYPDARKEFQRAVRLNKSYPEAHNNLGVTYYVNKQYGPAIKEYHRAINLNPASAHFHSNLGSAYFSEKQFDKATREFSEAMKLDPAIFDPTPSGGVSVKLATLGDRAYFHYVIAKMYGTRGDAEHCRLYLSKANEEGYPRVKDALKDDEFAGLRKDPGFVEFVRSLKPPAQLEANN